jgi:hypothetical protein
LHALYPALHRAERERVGRHPDPSAAVMDTRASRRPRNRAESAAMTAASSSRAGSATSWSIRWAFPSPGMSPPPTGPIPKALGGSWAAWRSSSRGSRRSGRTRPIAARSWRSGADNRATAGIWRSSSASRVPWFPSPASEVGR